MTASIVGVGAANAGLTSATTYALPAITILPNDWIYLVIEDATSTGLTPATGYSHITNSPRAQGSNVTTCNVTRKLAVGGETDPVSPADGNHQSGFTFVVRDGDTSGSLDFVTLDGSAANTTFSFLGGTTTNDNCLVINVATSSIDQATDPFGTATNSSLSSFGVVGFAGTANGNGGGIKVWSGIKTPAGVVGTTDGTCTSTARAVISFAIPPAATANPPIHVRSDPRRVAVMRASTF